MSKTADVLFSIVGATVAGVTVFMLDRHLASKASQSNAPVPSPTNLGVDNTFTTEFQAQVNALGQGSNTFTTTPVPQPSTSGASNCDSCGGSSQPSTPAQAPSLAQQSILDSMNNLASLEANAGVFANRSRTTVGAH